MERVVELWLTSGVIYKPEPPLPFEDLLHVYRDNGFFLVFEGTDNTHRIPKDAIVNIVTKQDAS